MQEVLLNGVEPEIFILEEVSHVSLSPLYDRPV